MATLAEILRHVVIIGMLPKSRVRAALIAAYARERALTELVPDGLVFESNPRVADVETLTDAELVAFLKGAALILGPSLRREAHCICNMRGCFVWPLAAYVTLLRRDVVRARKAWKAFAAIPRLCAERLPFGHPVDLRDMEFEEFVLRLSTDLDMEEPTFAARAAAAATRITEAFELDRG
ncbi:MAG: hypothetical protein EBR83_02845 [Verrucomicrobia bacterium]|nr:hypothetical protein [Verrucomicrobiota bacterium]